MNARRLLCLIALVLAAAAVAAPASSAAPRQAPRTAASCAWAPRSPFDSMNPFVAFQAISYVVFTNIYPRSCSTTRTSRSSGDWAKSWKTSKDGLTWTFTLKPGKWSDGKPLTADDAAWTGNTILKFAKGPAASLAPFISHATKLSAPNPSTLVIHYNKAVANVLPQLAAVLRAAAPRLGAGRRNGCQGPQGLRPARRTCRSWAAAPSSCRSTTRRARRSWRAIPASTAPGRTSTPSASPGSRTPTRCSPLSRATASTMSIPCPRPSRRHWASPVTSRSSRDRARKCATSPSTRARRRRRTASCSIPRCATPSRTRSTASRSSTSSSEGSPTRERPS